MKTVRDMNALYLESLRDLYSAETQLIKALPKMEEAASETQLKEGFRNHLHETRDQLTRLEMICRDLGQSPGGHFCRAMEGLIREGEELIDCIDDPKVLDAGLIGAAQKVEHYEISGYGTARAFARLLGYENHAEILRNTLEEESKTDHKFTEIAESLINERALQTASH